MCGRYVSASQTSEIVREFDVITVTQDALDIGPSWNVPPTTNVRIIIDRPARALERFLPTDQAPPEEDPDTVTRALHAARWGLVPHWADSLAMGARMINARSETAATKPSFKRPLATSRCVVVADGYYEWHTDAVGAKTPYYIYASDGRMLAFAGLFSWWRDPQHPADTEWILTTTILTAAARDGLEEIHDREPVMLPRDLLTGWLDPAITDPAAALEIIAEPGPEVTWHEVSPAVGPVRNNTPNLIAPYQPPPQQTLL